MAKFKEGQCTYQVFPVIVQFAMFILYPVYPELKGKQCRAHDYDYDKKNLIQSRFFKDFRISLFELD